MPNNTLFTNHQRNLTKYSKKNDQLASSNGLYKTVVSKCKKTFKTQENVDKQSDKICGCPKHPKVF